MPNLSLPPSTPLAGKRKARGFTLIEMSIVIAVILALSLVAGISITAITEWQKGKNASLSLQAVYTAQRSYMADFPTATIATVPTATLTGYLPTGWSAMPTMTGLKNEVLTLNATAMPPYFTTGTTRYDPSASTSDGLWDVGE